MDSRNHNHSHSHGSVGDLSQKELQALLKFNYSHNVSHTDELKNLCDRISEASPDCADLISKAAECYKSGNEYLEKAVKAFCKGDE